MLTNQIQDPIKKIIQHNKLISFYHPKVGSDSIAAEMVQLQMRANIICHMNIFWDGSHTIIPSDSVKAFCQKLVSFPFEGHG